MNTIKGIISDGVFSEYCKKKRDHLFETKDTLVYFENCLFFYRKGNILHQTRLDISQYNTLKMAAHTIIYHSLEDLKEYTTINELKRGISTGNISTDKATISELMEQASSVYMDELHKNIQLIKEKHGKFLKLLVIVCGSSSPRFGHPAMQYFARLTDSDLESNRDLQCLGVKYQSKGEEKKSQRSMVYVENAKNLYNALEIGYQLHLQDQLFSQFVNMKTDVLAPYCHQILEQKCSNKSNL